MYNKAVTDEAGDVSLMPSVSVLAYNNYTVSVQAFTGAGGGETVDTIVLSPQAGISGTLHISNYICMIYMQLIMCTHEYIIKCLILV